MGSTRRLAQDGMEAIETTALVDSRHILIANCLRKEQQAVETEIKVVFQGSPGSSPVHRPQMDDSLRSLLSFDQVRQQTVIILADSGAS